MMSLGRDGRLLGIAVGERALQVAEVTSVAGSAPAARRAEFVYPDGISLDHPQPLGEALAHFLQWHGFSARRAVLGAPAKWLVTRPHLMPPTDAATAASALWIKATEEVSPELGEMVFDFAGESSPSTSTYMLLVGLQRARLEKLIVLAKAAGLKLSAITPSGAAIAAASAQFVDRSLILWLGDGNAELMTQEDHQIRSIRHIGPGAAAGPLIAELRRSAAAAMVGGGNGELPESPHASRNHWRRGLVLWDDVGIDQSFRDALRDGVDLPLVPADSQWVDVNGSIQNDRQKGLSALALTLSERGGRRLAVDFLHPRLLPPRVSRFSGRISWPYAATAAGVLAAVAGYADILHLQSQATAAADEMAVIRPDFDRATKFVDNMKFADSFMGRSPRSLACLRDLAAAVDAQTYFTSFRCHDDMKGEITGRSSNEQSVLSLIEKLNAGANKARFIELNPRLDPPHGLRGAASEITFTVSFTYVPRS
jgi:hypothetical protein